MTLLNLLNYFAGPPCGASGASGFFKFPTWYKYLPSVDPVPGKPVQACAPDINGIGDIWLVVAAVLEMLLRVAAIAAVVFVIWGGVQYITSQGQSEKTVQARKTITNALIGLVLAVGSAALVSFIAGRFN